MIWNKNKDFLFLPSPQKEGNLLIHFLLSRNHWKLLRLEAREMLSENILLSTKYNFKYKKHFVSKHQKLDFWKERAFKTIQKLDNLFGMA